MTKHLDIISVTFVLIVGMLIYFLPKESKMAGQSILYSVMSISFVLAVAGVLIGIRVVVQQIEGMAMSVLNVSEKYYEVKVKKYEADTCKQVLLANGNAYHRESLALLPTPNIIRQLSEISSPLQLSTGVETDENKLFDTFKRNKAIHALVYGSRNGGKSTLVNRLMNEEFSDYDTTIIDDLFNQVDSGWVMHDKCKVSREFLPTLTEFYQSHMKLKGLVKETRGGHGKRLLVIDEFPTLIANLKRTENYEPVMAMLRSIYSQGSHTEHNVIIISQTVLTQDIGLSSNDKCNFIQIAIGGLAGDFLSLRRGKAHKDKLYEKLSTVASQYPYYACFEDNSGTIDIQPLPDLSSYGAKRKYGSHQVNIDEVEWKVGESEIQSEVTTDMDTLRNNQEKLRYDKTGKVVVTSVAQALNISTGGNHWYRAENAARVWDSYKEKQQ